MRISDGSSDVCSSDLAGQPVFVMARPDGRQVWVNFAHPDNGVVQVIDTESLSIVATLRPGPAVLHMELTAPGDQTRGQASWWERVCPYVEVPVVAGSLKKKNEEPKPPYVN